MIPCELTIVLDTDRTSDQWCVFEHLTVLGDDPTAPPTVILVGACRLTEVLRLTDGKSNTEWVNLFAHGGSVMVRIIGTTNNRQEAYREAAERMRRMNPMPRCNVHGYSVRNRSRAIICLNNGKVYDSQKDAALELQINASSISRHLGGDLNHVAGFKFAYATEKDRG